MNKVKYILGEDKHIKFLVRAPNNEPFTILEAVYVLSRYGVVESEGACEINGHYLDIKLAPKDRCRSYTLEITFKVADSTRKVRVRIEVV